MSDGSLVCKYVYDAWGNHKVLNPDGTENTEVTFLGNVNPFRYRGYYYDVITGLYYLQTRYYDPETGRFISQDDSSYLAPETINGLNLYAYCGNNPVMRVDPTGTFVFSTFILSIVAGAIAGAIIGGMYGGITAAANGQNVVGGIIIGTIGGALIGAASGAAAYLVLPVFGAAEATITGLTVAQQAVLGSAIAFAGGFIGGFGIDIATQLYNDSDKIDIISAICSGLQWGVINTVNAFASGALGSLSFGTTLVTNMAYNTLFGSTGLLFDVIRNYNRRANHNAAKAVYYNYPV